MLVGNVRHARDALNHLSKRIRIAETALEVISLCRLMSISSGVGAGGAGSAGTAAFSACVAADQPMSNHVFIATYEDSPW
jgi:hypothetical protein